MSRHYIQKIGSAILAATMAAGMMPAQILAAGQDENPTEKTETVYTVLNPDGSVDSTIVSAWLHDDDGLHNVKEDLQLKNVENVKGDDKPSVSGSTYTWNSQETDIWYKGDATRQLPVAVKISTSWMAKTSNRSSWRAKRETGDPHQLYEQRRAAGEPERQDCHDSSVFPGWGMMDMDAENCKNVKCSQGKIVSDSTNEFLAFAAVPGLEETMKEAGLSDMASDLDISDDIEITADVKDYDPASLMMAMTNDLDLEEIPQLGSISELTGGVKQLYDASLQLEDGSRQLYEGLPS